MGKHRDAGWWVFGRWFGRAAVVALVIGFVLLTITGIRAWNAYRTLERVPFEEPAQAAGILATIPDEVVDELRAEEDAAEEAAILAEAQERSPELLAQLEAGRVGIISEFADEDSFPFVSSPGLPDEMFDAYLLVGVEGTYRADAIILVLLPEDGSSPLMVSLPRDLYVPNPCTQRFTRINAGLAGCREYASGAELLSLMVADFTGIEVDHFARVDFGGFRRVIDVLGGVEICVEHAVRDRRAELSLPAGCSKASGSQALAWVRSRRTEEFVDGQWRPVPGVSDFTRQQKEQDMLFKIAGRLNSFSSFASFSALAESLVGTVVLDANFSFGDAVSLAWNARGITSEDVVRLTLHMDNYVTPAGAWVLLPEAPFNAVLAAEYPPAAR